MRVAVVTGTARTAGIGHAICSSLLEEGHAVIGIDYHPLESASPLHGQGRFVSKVASVTDVEGVSQSIKSALAELQQTTISVVVNNAAIAQPFLQTPPGNDVEAIEKRLEEFDRYLSVNLRSAFLVTEVCRSYFPDNTAEDVNLGGASVVHIGSTRARQSPAPSEEECPYGQEGYAAAKAGLLGLMHSQGQALVGRARVNVISPGWINTDPEYDPSTEDHLWHTTGRVGKPADVAAMVLFLADETKSGFVTCQEFVLDGGVTRKMVYPE